METLDRKKIIPLPDGSSVPLEEGWFMPTENPFLHGCCACGLMHRVEFLVVDKDGREIAIPEGAGIALRFTRDEPETARQRGQKVDAKFI